MKTRIVSFRMSLDEIEKLDHIAQKYGMNRNQIIRELVSKAIKTQSISDERGSLPGLDTR